MRFGAPLVLASVLLSAAMVTDLAIAQPTPGFVEDFTSGIGDFGGAATVTNPGTGGVDGAGDGFLHIARATAAQLGARAASGPLTGNYVVGGVERMRFWLNDVDADQDLEINFLIGNTENFWRFNTPFVPPEDAWAEFEVDFTTPSSWTQLFGIGTFEEALQTVNRVLFRHDLAPYTQQPDPIAGEFGVDRIELIGAGHPVDPGTWGEIKSLFR
jgi:hypothetical protein